MGDEDPNQPRQPRNLQGILRFCTEVTASEDTTTTTQASEMDPERKEWLDSALAAFSVSPVDRMKECVGLILKSEDTEAEQDNVESLIEEITETCEQIDFANDFYKIGGYQTFNHLLKSSHSQIRCLTLSLIATLVQNNPVSQKNVLDFGLLPTLLTILDTDCNDKVKVKSLYAISCLVRDMPDAQKSFLEHDGFSKLMRAMQCDEEKLKVKGAFMLASFCSEQPAIKDTLCDMGMVDQLVGLLSETHQPSHEHIMSALLALVTDHQRAQQDARQPQLQLKNLLQQRNNYLHGKEEFMEEKEHVEEILKVCFGEIDSDFKEDVCR